MVAASEYSLKSNIVHGKKVSKPLMEKKRRARINRCLDQLKTLLENYYTNNIRKRKLEKADILELTVKHLRNLQKIQHGPSVNTKFAEYQAGYRSCLTGVNQYLLMAEKSSGSSRLNMLSHISSNLLAAEGASRSSRTLDSDTAEQVAPGAAAQTSHSTTARPESSKAFATDCQSPNSHAPKNPSINVCSLPQATERANGYGEKEKRQLYAGNASNNLRDSMLFKEVYPRNRCLTEGQYSNEFVGIMSHNYWRPW